MNDDWRTMKVGCRELIDALAKGKRLFIGE
jgi:hypothetical protein